MSGAILIKNPSGALAARGQPLGPESMLATPVLPHDGHSRLICDLTKTPMPNYG
jgi:hypothetical protein